MRRIVCVGVLCMCAAPLAMADLSVKYVGLEDGVKSVSVETSDQGNAVSNFAAGLYKLSVNGETVYGFCIDVADSAPTKTVSNYEAKVLADSPDTWAGPMGETRAKYLAVLLDTYWTDWGDTVASSSLKGISTNQTYTDDQIAAALQLAIWEIVDEYNWDESGVEVVSADQWDVTNRVSKGPYAGEGFIVSSSWYLDRNRYNTNYAIVELANAMLDYIATRNVDSYDTNNYAVLSSTTAQDYVVRVPVPAAALLGFLGFGAAGLKLRRFV